MCGITGILAYKSDPGELIELMNNQIINRGPDTSGVWIDEDRRVALGHRRLSILDLSEAGAQPYVSRSGRYVLVYNGEIYNVEAIREELNNANHQMAWRGHSDTEVLLEAIELWGLEATLCKCKGMWALAVYDRETHVISLARDRIGEKPLYYGIVNGQFVWASDINAIRALPEFNNDIASEVLGIYFTRGYIPAPYTIYKGIYKLDAGNILTISHPWQSWSIHSYYDVISVATNVYGTFDGSEKEAADELERLLKASIRDQMIADVPLGAFLSGGIDSTLVVSLMQSLSDKPVRSFTIGFEEERFNEATFARETAKHLGTNHTEMYVGHKDVMGLLDELPQIFGEPFADSSSLPTLLVSKMTREHVTVSLSGDAGDELFCGYNTYKDARSSIDVMQGKLGFIKGPIRRHLGRSILKGPFASNDTINKIGRCLAVETVEDFYRMVKDNDVRIHQLPLHKTKLLSKIESYEDGLLPDDIANLCLMDVLDYLPDDILVKVDRSAMRYSLETRIPLLDADIVRFAWSLPLKMKMSDGITKKPLRNILYRYVPKSMMDRPKKGFSVPVGEWLRTGQMRDWAESIIADSKNKASNYIDTKLVDSMWNNYIGGGDYNSLIWYVLMLEQWMISS